MGRCSHTPLSPAPGRKRKAGMMVPDDKAVVRETSSTVSAKGGKSPLRYDWDDVAYFLMKHVQECPRR